MKHSLKFIAESLLILSGAFLYTACSENSLNGEDQAGETILFQPAISYQADADAVAYSHLAWMFQDGNCMGAQSTASAATLAPFSLTVGSTYELSVMAVSSTQSLILPTVEAGVSKKGDVLIVKNLAQEIPDLLGAISPATLINNSTSSLALSLAHLGAQLSVIVTPETATEGLNYIDVTVKNMYNSITIDGKTYAIHADYPQELSLKLELSEGVYKSENAFVMPTAGDKLMLVYTLYYKDGSQQTFTSEPAGSILAGKKNKIETTLTALETNTLQATISYEPWSADGIEVDDNIIAKPGNVAAPTPLVPSSFSEWGDATIVSQYSVGPGVTYANVRYSGTREQNVFILRVDLQNQYNNIEGYSQKIPASSYAKVAAQCAANSDLNGHRVIGGVNQDYFISSDGSDKIRIAYGPNIKDGKFYSPAWNAYAMLALTKEKTASVFGIKKGYQTYASNAIFPSGQSVGITYYNSVAALWADFECYFYTDMNSLSTLPSYQGATAFVRISNAGEWYVNGEDKSCEVLEISSTSIVPDATSFVLAFNDKSWSNPGAATYAKNTLKVGDQIKIRQRINASFGTAPSNIVTGFHGLPCILSEGAVNSSQISAAQSENGTSRRGRTLMGLTQDKRYIYIVAVDGPEKTSYAGTAPTESAKYMLSLGCYDALNFDGGGSTEMVMGSRIDNTFTTLNTPSDGNSRSVINTAQVVCTAPHNTTTASYAITTPLITGAQTLAFVGLNTYGEVTEKSVSAANFTYTCEPSTIGTVSDSGVFTPGATKTGTIIATHKTHKFVAKTTVQLP